MAPLYLNLVTKHLPGCLNRPSVIEAVNNDPDNADRHNIDLTEANEFITDEAVRWYLEDYPRKPVLNQSSAAAVSRALKQYGRALASQIQKCPFVTSKGRSQDALVLNIWSAEPVSPVQRHFWEILENVDLWDASLGFRQVSVLRSVYAEDDNAAPPPDHFEEGKLRFLFVVARRTKDGKNIDRIDPRIVTQSALNVLKKHKYTLEAEILRPPTWSAFRQALLLKPKGHYYMVHFDMHGHVDQDSQKAFLEFQSEESLAIESITASEVAQVLVAAGVYAVNLNACNSAMPSSSPEGNLAYLFARRGIPRTVAMSFDVLEDTAKVFESVFYKEYIYKWDESAAAKRGRQALANQRKRKAAFNTTIDLDDYFVPVCYKCQFSNPAPPSAKSQHRSLSSTLIEGIASAVMAPFIAYRRVKNSVQERRPPKPAVPAPIQDHGPIGRSAAIFDIERLLSRPTQGFLFLVGPPGSGKTVLLKHLASWWKQSGFVDHAFYHTLYKNNKMKDVVTELFPFIRLDARGPCGWAKDWDTLWEETVAGLRSKKALLILDDADLPIALDSRRESVQMANSRLMTSEETFLFGMTARTVMELLESLQGSECRVLLASRWRPEWMGGDRQFACDHIYVLPKVQMSDALALASKALGQRSDQYDQDEPPQMRAVITQLEHNPLAISTSIPLVFQRDKRPFDALNRLWSAKVARASFFEGFREKPRYVIFLQKYSSEAPKGETPDVNIWSAFWIADFFVRPPDPDGVFWMWISLVLMMVETGNTQLQDRVFNGLDLTPPASDFDEALRGFNQKYRLVDSYEQVMSSFARSGILFSEDEANEDLRVHPLFSMVARDGTFGIKDKKLLARLSIIRTQITWRYTLWRVMRSIERHTSGGESDWSQIIPEIERDFADIIRAMEAICRPDILSDAAFAAASATDESPVMQTLGILEKVCVVRDGLWTPYAALRRKLLDRCMAMEETILGDETQFYNACEHLQALASVSGLILDSQTSDSFETYKVMFDELIAKRRERLGVERSTSLQTQIRKFRTTEALNMVQTGRPEPAELILEDVMTQEPDFGPIALRQAHVLRVIHGWVAMLTGRKKGFPTPHELLQMKEPILSVVLRLEARSEEQLATYCQTALGLLNYTYYDLQKTSQPLSLPPRTRQFNAQFLKVYKGTTGAAQVLGSMRVDPLEFEGGHWTKSVDEMTKMMKKHALTTGREGDLAHAKLCEVALASEDWRDAIKHLTIFNGRKVSDRPSIHLIYTLCYGKLKQWQAARDHAVCAMEVAERVNDRTLLPIIYGSVAGLIHGKNGHYSALPKILMLKGLYMLYAKEDPLPSHIENRRGALLGQLLRTVWSQSVARSLGLESVSMPQRCKRYKPLEEWEDLLDNILINVDFAVDHWTDGISYDGGVLRRALTQEAEHILFSYEMPDMSHFGSEDWAQAFIMDGRKVTYWDMTEPNILSGRHYEALLEGGAGKAKQQLQFDVSDDVSEDGSCLSSSSSEDEETDGVISWSKCFHEPFLEEVLMPRQAQRSVEAREETVRLLSMMDSKVEELIAKGGIIDQSKVHQAVEELMAEALDR